MDNVRETDVQKAILDFLFYRAGFFWRNNSLGVYDANRRVYIKPRGKHALKGVSDILGILDGQFIAIEVKSEKGRVSKEQKDFINQINAMGGKAFIARSVEDVERELYGERDGKY